MRILAAQMAIAAHGDQLWSGKAYYHHLWRVERCLRDFGFDNQFWHDAAWLHDTLEDTTLTYSDLFAIFGQEITDIVYRVSGFGPNRKARFHDILSKISKSQKACILKAADRIVNLEMTRFDKNIKYTKIYLAEKDEFLSVVNGAIPTEMLARLKCNFHFLEKMAHENA